MDCSLPGPWSMRFSRHEYWSGLPFPRSISPVKYYSKEFIREGPRKYMYGDVEIRLEREDRQ